MPTNLISKIPNSASAQTVSTNAIYTTRRMKKIFCLTVLCVFTFSAFSQFGLSSPFYTGRDAKLINASWFAEIPLSIPFYVPLKLKDSTRRISFLFQPTVKFDWYNFNKNLTVDRQNGYTSFIEDSDINHSYKKKFLKTSSMIQSTSFNLPITLVFRSKKLKTTFAPGIFVGYLIRGKFKRKYDDNGSPIEITNRFNSDKDFYGFQRLQYGFCGYISYKFVTVYGIYSLTTLFKPTNGIYARRSEVGILINLFWKKHDLKPY